MTKKVVISEEKLVDLIYNIVESSLKELNAAPKEVVAKVVKEEVKAPVKKVVKTPVKKVVKITEDKLVSLIDKIVKEQIAEMGKKK